MSQPPLSGALSRRKFITTAAAAGAGAVLTGALSQYTAAATSHRRPNILFILADDLGWADPSVYGRPFYGQAAYLTPPT